MEVETYVDTSFGNSLCSNSSVTGVTKNSCLCFAYRSEYTGMPSRAAVKVVFSFPCRKLAILLTHIFFLVAHG